MSDEEHHASSFVLFLLNLKRTLGQLVSSKPRERDEAVKQHPVVEQYAADVVDFSSQYGRDYGLCYTAENLKGPHRIYPRYGDFAEAFVTRTYGIWWDLAPSACEPFQRVATRNTSRDFIDILFKKMVFPNKLEIYETFNPGSTVRILAAQVNHEEDSALRWKVLWEGMPQCAPAVPRVYSPQLDRCDFVTSLIRIEFSHCHLSYYTSLDAVRLLGSAETPDPHETLDPPETDGLDRDNNSCTDRGGGGGGDGLARRSVYGTRRGDDCRSLVDMPEEVIQYIISFFDILDLCRVAQTCRTLCKHCYDAQQFTELDLQPYWHMITDAALAGLAGRCHLMRRLSLSWCGPYHNLTEAGFVRFLQSCGGNLTCLRLASCTEYVTNSSLKIIVDVCPGVTELDVRCCGRLGDEGFAEIARASRLQRLNLYRTAVRTSEAALIVRNCVHLEMLNFDSCSQIANFHEVAVAIAENLRELKCLNVCRVKSVGNNSLVVIAQTCGAALLELDVGWCVEVSSRDGCLVNLARRCPRLRALYLTSIRTINDRDLQAFAAHCRDLEQLDILGSMGVTPIAVAGVLLECTQLKLLDVSYCTCIEFIDVHRWRQMYPEVTIQKSFKNI